MDPGSAKHPCVVCGKEVGARQEALQCDECAQWQHRVCNSGMTRQQYRLLMKQVEEFDWRCTPCKLKPIVPMFSEPTLNTPINDDVMSSREPECYTELPLDQPLPATSLLNSTYTIHVDNNASSDNDQVGNFDLVYSNTLSPSTENVFNESSPNNVSLDDSSPNNVSLDDSSHNNVSLDDSSPNNVSLDLSSSDNVSLDESSDDIPSEDEQQIFRPIELRESPNRLDDRIVFSRPTNQHEPVTYQIVDKGTKRCQRKLFDSIGFAYTLRKKPPSQCYWSCAIRGKQMNCPATVIQNGENFRAGNKKHIHAPKPGQQLVATMNVKIKETAAADFFQPAQEIVERVYLADVGNHACHSLPSMPTMERRANRHRQRMRPREPVDLDFEIPSHSIPDNFLVADIKAGQFRHLLFATPEQLKLLSNARTWYMDATFKITKRPFKQLLSIHAFLHSDDGSSAKQVPLAFCLMSRKCAQDYRKVFRAIKTACRTLNVQRLVIDFEKGVWTAAREVLDDIEIRGCSFHWCQAVFRRMKSMGLEKEYVTNKPFHALMKKVLALPYLHATDIPQALASLQAKVDNPTVIRLFNYISNTWLHDRTWTTQSWSVFGLFVRTNNDCEGWHRRMNARARRGSLQFFLLVKLLHDESLLLPLQRRLVADGQLRQNRKKQSILFQSKLEDIWKEYERKEKTAIEVLGLIAKIKD